MTIAPDRIQQQITILAQYIEDIKKYPGEKQIVLWSDNDMWDGEIKISHYSDKPGTMANALIMRYMHGHSVKYDKLPNGISIKT